MTTCGGRAAPVVGCPCPFCRRTAPLADAGVLIAVGREEEPQSERLPLEELADDADRAAA